MAAGEEVRCARCNRVECPMLKPFNQTGDDSRDCAAHAIDWRAQALAEKKAHETTKAVYRDACEHIENLECKLEGAKQHAEARRAALAVVEGRVNEWFQFIRKACDEDRHSVSRDQLRWYIDNALSDLAALAVASLTSQPAGGERIWATLMAYVIPLEAIALSHWDQLGPGVRKAIEDARAAFRQVTSTTETSADLRPLRATAAEREKLMSAKIVATGHDYTSEWHRSGCQACREFSAALEALK